MNHLFKMSFLSKTRLVSDQATIPCPANMAIGRDIVVPTGHRYLMLYSHINITDPVAHWSLYHYLAAVAANEIMSVSINFGPDYNAPYGSDDVNTPIKERILLKPGNVSGTYVLSNVSGNPYNLVSTIWYLDVMA